MLEKYNTSLQNISASVIVPTKNRKDDLLNAVKSVCCQKILPNQLIIVDQSDLPESRDAIEKMLSNFPNIELMYIYDRSISGLIMAKDVGVRNSTGDIIFFIEDDVILTTDYLFEMTSGFLYEKDMLGCCGVINNIPKSSFFQAILFNFFHRGIFFDPRFKVFNDLSQSGDELILSSMLSGGVSAWRREVFEAVFFDLSNNFHMLEDIDFSSRAFEIFGPRFYINKRARLSHYPSSTGRSSVPLRQRKKVYEYIIYYKKRKAWRWALPSTCLVLFGIFLQSVFLAITSRSVAPFFSYFYGLSDGCRRNINS